MAETYVGSKELTVTVLKDDPLCVTEITTNEEKEFYNYSAKYDKNGSFHVIPALINKIHKAKINRENHVRFWGWPPKIVYDFVRFHLQSCTILRSAVKHRI